MAGIVYSVKYLRKVWTPGIQLHAQARPSYEVDIVCSLTGAKATGAWSSSFVSAWCQGTSMNILPGPVQYFCTGASFHCVIYVAQLA
jgi:hypothetical protein